MTPRIIVIARALAAIALLALASCADDKTPGKAAVTTPERPSEIRIGNRCIAIGYDPESTKPRVDSIAITEGGTPVWNLKLTWMPDSMTMTGTHDGQPVLLAFHLSGANFATNMIEYAGASRTAVAETAFYYDSSGFLSNLKTTYYRTSGNNSATSDRYVKFEVDNNSINHVNDNADIATRITYSRVDDNARISVAMTLWDSEAYQPALYAGVLGRASGKLPTKVETLRDSDKHLLHADTIDSYDYSPEGNLLRCRIRPLEGSDSAATQVTVKYQH